MKSQSRLASFRAALSGALHGLKTERNIQIHSFMAVLVIGLGFYFKVNKIEWLFLIGCISLVLVTELLNSAIEHCVDLVTLEYNERAKFAKDLGAAAVLVAALLSSVIGTVIFYPKIMAIL